MISKAFQHKAFVRVVSFILFFVIFGMMFLTPALMSTAEAANPAIPVVAVAGLAALLGLIGITFTTVDGAKAAAEMTSAMDDLWKDINSIITPPDGSDPNDPYGKIKINLASTGLIADILAKLKQLFNADGTGSISADGDGFIYNNVIYTDRQFTSVLPSEVKAAYDLAPYSGSNTFVINNFTYAFSVVESVPVADAIKWTLHCNGSPVRYGSYDLGAWTLNSTSGGAGRMYNFLELVGFRYGFTRWSATDSSLRPFIAYCWKNKNTGNLEYGYIQPNSTGNGTLPITGSNQHVQIDYPYESNTVYPQEDIWTSINEIVVGDGQVEIPLKEIGSDIESENETEYDKKKQGYWVDLIPGLRDLLEEKSMKDPLPNPTPIPSPGTDGDPDAPYKPAITGIPDLTTIWDYVEDFAADALIWVKLWFSGFVLLPAPLKGTLWAVLVITIFTGLLGVFLK